ncbi:ac78 [Palpita vitrealis nucleopolyhedrovirus]|uniref:Ac78 n=1 Tax=Palpita vitrealis nucleopolyhedrovirus TaxID=2951960 RepID=A0AAE9LNI3_9ABAC|nr:ac78 [Palpita vitrealis nucleopolyhedrovirus]
MNLDVPYYRLGNHEKVEYIPLKLALNDDDDVNKQLESQQHVPQNDMLNFDNATATTKMSAGVIILISVFAFMVLFLLLYVIYYFVILRDRHQYSTSNIDDISPFVFNKFD